MAWPIAAIPFVAFLATLDGKVWTNDPKQSRDTRREFHIAVLSQRTPGNKRRHSTTSIPTFLVRNQVSDEAMEEWDRQWGMGCSSRLWVQRRFVKCHPSTIGCDSSPTRLPVAPPRHPKWEQFLETRKIETKDVARPSSQHELRNCIHQNTWEHLSHPYIVHIDSTCFVESTEWLVRHHFACPQTTPHLDPPVATTSTDMLRREAESSI